MYIEKKTEGNTTIVSPVGRLDTTTSPDFENEIKGLYDTTENLVIDMEKLDYISSAGLRVLLAVQKQMSGKGSMVIRNANEIVLEVFEVTGFVDVLNIE